MDSSETPDQATPETLPETEVLSAPSAEVPSNEAPSTGPVEGTAEGNSAEAAAIVPPAAEGDHPVQQLIFMELKFILEALLFTSQKPLSIAELRDILTQAANEEGAAEGTRALRKLPAGNLERALQELARDHEAAGRSYRLVCIAGAWQFVTEPDYAPWLRVMLGVKTRPSRLSQAALETLAIIAYRQPITRAEMEQIRGVAVDGTITTLVERQLIQQAGRAEVIGRPMQYATTQEFLGYFGLASLSSLPAADELRRIPVQRPDTLATVDPGLTTAPIEPVQQMTLEQAENAGAGGPTVDAEIAPEVPPAAPTESSPAPDGVGN